MSSISAPDPSEGLPWFHGLPVPGPGEAASEEARRWQELVEAREAFLRYLRHRESERRSPASHPNVAPGFWSPTPIPGFRLWYFHSGCLRGVRETWIRPELQAQCAQRGSGAPHAGAGCRCGIHALKAPERLPRPRWGARARPGMGIAYGLVALSGVVIEHEYGYRAARAEAVAMAVLLQDRAVGGADRWWIRRLFQRPDRAIDEVEKGVWPRVRIMAPTAEEVVRFLRAEAARLEQAWTSASRSE